MRYHRGHDGWGRDYYAIPQYAVAGSSDCGTWSDSPAPSDKVKAELMAFRAVLKAAGIKSRFSGTQSGNCFMGKVWVTVHSRDFTAAHAVATKYLEETKDSTQYIHDDT